MRSTWVCKARRRVEKTFLREADGGVMSDSMVVAHDPSGPSGHLPTLRVGRKDLTLVVLDHLRRTQLGFVRVTAELA
jgi:hypothetical protein